MNTGLRTGLLSVAIFVGFWLFYSQSWPLWSESVSVYPAPAGRVLAPVRPGHPRTLALESGCRESDGMTVRSSSARPIVSLCLGGRRFPVLISSYASGVPYWISELFRPLHRDNVFRLRASGLILGLLGMFFVGRLVRTFAGRTEANAAVFGLAVTPPFLLMHSTLIHYEILPFLACSVALDRLTPCHGLISRAGSEVDRRVPTGNLLAAAALASLAVIANFKAVFIILPLLAFALRAGVRPRALSRIQVGAMVAVAALVALPSILANALYTEGNFLLQVDTRIGILFNKASLSRFVVETGNLIWFWSDIFSLAALAPGEVPRAPYVGMLVAVPSLVYCTVCAVAFFVRGEGRIVPAACGTLMLTSLALQALLYDQYPAGNHTPLSAVFGIATALSALAAAEWVAARASVAVRPVRAIALALTAVCLLWGMVTRGSPARFAEVSFNAHAVKELAEFLESEPSPDGELYVTTYNLAGIVEAVTGGASRGIQAHGFLDCREYSENLEPRDCLDSRLTEILDAHPESLRFLVPARVVHVDEPHAAMLPDALSATAGAAGRSVAVEAKFNGLGTGPLLQVFRVGPDASEAR